MCPMVEMEKKTAKKLMLSKGAWTPEEDKKLEEVVTAHGAKRWKIIAYKAGVFFSPFCPKCMARLGRGGQWSEWVSLSGLKRCGKSCRLRWMNYLRPNIKRGNITDQEEDLILRLHKLLGNRWSLIAGRLPGRTDNEIKNYWNSQLSKRMRQNVEGRGVDPTKGRERSRKRKSEEGVAAGAEPGEAISSNGFDMEEFFDFSNESPLHLEWVRSFLQLDNRQIM